ncbi:MAG: hypothetical protein Q8R70_05060 [Methanoregula sp.]|nr:hypothetical protein [Methanoregula sp.]
MYKPAGIAACFFIILLISVSGCSILSTAPKPAIKQGTTGEHAVFETPTLPDQYTARGPKAASRNPVQTVVVTTKGQKPVLRSAAKTTIEGSGLTGDGTYNETVQQMVTYLTEKQDYSNSTIVQNETTFWNSVAYYVQKKIDSENAITIDFTNAHISPLHNGSYSIDQVSDIWDYVMPPRWTYVNDTMDGDSPFGDHFSAASETINKGLKGDCDDFAILNAATTSVLGGKSRIVYASSGGVTHMYGEAQFGNASFINSTKARYSTTADINYHPGYWLNLDWFDWPNTATHPGGKFYGGTGTIWVMYKEGTWEKQEKIGSNWTVILKGPA